MNPEREEQEDIELPEVDDTQSSSSPGSLSDWNKSWRDFEDIESLLLWYFPEPQYERFRETIKKIYMLTLDPTTEGFLEDFSEFFYDEATKLAEKARVHYSSFIPLRKNLDEYTSDRIFRAWADLRPLIPNGIISRDTRGSADFETKAKKSFDKLFPCTIGENGLPSKVIPLAFQSKERTNLSGESPSKYLFGQLQAYFKEYCRDSNLYHSPYTTLVGPSGIGKSFTMRQIALNGSAYVGYLSFMKRSMGFPRRSSVAELPENVTRDYEKVRFWTIIIRFMLAERDFCARYKITPVEVFDLHTVHETEHLIYRTSFSESIQEIYKSGMDLEGDRFQKKVQDCLRKLIGPIIRQRSARYFQKDHTISGTSSLDLVICLDEASALLEGEHFSREYFSHFHAFRRAAAGCFPSSKRFFAILIDTTSQISNFVPTFIIDSSQRVTTKHQLFAPLYLLRTYDCYFSSKKGKETVEPKAQLPNGSLEAIEWLYRAGRPLWGAILAASESSKIPAEDRVKDTRSWAESKLRLARLEYGPEFYLLALLCQRVSLTIIANDISEKLVSRGMRYLTHISTDRSVLSTIQPSEPILAHAAMRLMADSWGDILKQLGQDFRPPGVVDAGDFGEIIAAVIIVFTFDRTLVKQPQYETHKTFALPVNLYLENLFSRDLVQFLRKKISPNARAVLDQGQVFPQQFIRLTLPIDPKTLRKIPLTEKQIRDAFLVGVAWFLPKNSEGADILIPIFIHGKVSCILIQVKNRKYDKMTPSLKVEARESLRRAAHKLEVHQYHPIKIMMCLRHDAKEEPSIEVIPDGQEWGFDNAALRPNAIRRTRSNTTSAATQPQACIVSVGIGQQYSTLNERTSKMLLTIQDLLKQHPYEAYQAWTGFVEDLTIPRDVPNSLDPQSSTP